MDFDQLKNDIQGIADVASSVPEPFRERAFDLLLTEYLREVSGPSGLGSPDPAPDEGETGAVLSGTDAQEDIGVGDLHAKTKKFLESNGLSLQHINELFYKEGEDILPLYEDLGTNQLSESQLRIALLQALLNGMGTGDFVFNGEAVRQEAQERKAYDPSNFTANFKANAKNFDGFEKYVKTEPEVRLSLKGKKRLALLIKEMSGS